MPYSGVYRPFLTREPVSHPHSLYLFMGGFRGSHYDILKLACSHKKVPGALSRAEHMHRCVCVSVMSMNKITVNCNVTVVARKQEYLDIFSIKLFIQWKALDYPLITGMESTQLYPLVGGISANRDRKKRRCKGHRISYVTWLVPGSFIPCKRVKFVYDM